MKRALFLRLATTTLTALTAFQCYGQVTPTPHHVLAKDILLKAVLPTGAPTTPPDPAAFPPTEMDASIQYRVFQDYCDIKLRGIKPLTPNRDFKGLIGLGTDPLGTTVTVPAQTVSALPQDVPVAPFLETYDINRKPIRLFSKLTDGTGTTTEVHKFDSSMEDGPELTVSAGELIGEKKHPTTHVVTEISHRFPITYQTPAQEYLQADLDDGYEFTQLYRYDIKRQVGGAGGTTTVATVDVPSPWRRGQTYVELKWQMGQGGPVAGVSYSIRRQSKTTLAGAWANDPTSDEGTKASATAKYPQPCFAGTGGF